MAKKSKWFTVATEGATTDGRNIERKWLEEAAESYDPVNTYGARVNLEHIKFNLFLKDQPHSLAFGDVLALKTQERKDGKLQLLAKISPTDGLIELNKNRQKIYTSVELDTNFANTGKAYLVGLAVTDNPASLGLEMLQFSHNGLTARKLKADNIFTCAEETAIEFEEKGKIPGFVARLCGVAMFEENGKHGPGPFSQQEQQEQALLFLANETEHQAANIEYLQAKYNEISEQHANLEQRFKELNQKQEEFFKRFAEFEEKQKQLEQHHDSQYQNRPTVTGSQPQEFIY